MRTNLVVTTTGLAIVVAACGSRGTESGFRNDDTSDQGDGGSVTNDASLGGSNGGGVPSFGDASAADASKCTNLQCKQVVCPMGGDTTVTGVVHAPAMIGADPLYNAIVYVPNAALSPFPKGVSCEQCGALASGSPVVTALSAPDGSFTLKNVPAGDNVPLVVQLGRWRRQVVIPHVAACAATALPDELTRLPRNQSEGDIPLTAISTGDADALECVLRKIGLDDAEFTTNAGNGRIHLFEMNGAQLPAIASDTALTGDLATLKNYDIVIFDCTGERDEKAAAAQQRLIDYTSAGGRVFASHYNFTWLYNDAPFSGTTNWNPVQTDPPDPLTGTIDTSFPKGQAFEAWLKNVGAESGPGQISINVPRHDADSVIAPSQRWIYSDAPATLQHYTFNTPVGVAPASQCGRVVFSDFHVTGAGGDSGGMTFPAECDSGPLTPQEQVLEFMLFDLASCIQVDGVPPAPPPVN